ncbi:hypothetical protein ACHAP5_006882 [Fusarium lateritium]
MFRQAAAATTLRTGENAKMFWKRLNEQDGVYYVVNKKQQHPKRPKESEYFQINDLLLDLDDMFSKTVRPVEEEDDVRALKKWSRDYKREGIQRELHKLERLKHLTFAPDHQIPGDSGAMTFSPLLYGLHPELH